MKIVSKKERKEEDRKKGKRMCIIISLVFELVPCWRQKQLMSPPKAAPPSPVRPERLHHGSGSDNRLAPPWRTPGERNH